MPDDAYVLLGPPADEVYVLDRDGIQWRVYYAERGIRTEERTFVRQDEACAEMLRRLRRDFEFDSDPEGHDNE